MREPGHRRPAPRLAPGAALEAVEVSRRLGDTQALDGASIALKPGRITALLGPSGSGKSTLLRVLAGLEDVDAGHVLAPSGVMSAPGLCAPPERRRLGVVFQDYALFPHLSVAQNVAFGLDWLARPERAARAQAFLDAVGLGARADAYPHELSGGEQQRIALARALAPSPDAVLMDEPFSNLDGELRRTTREHARTLLTRAHAAALVVTHDVEEAMSLADELALMRDGRVIQTGRPADVYLNPVSAAAARLTGDVNAYDGLVKEGGLATPFGVVAANGAREGAAARALVRPEGVVLFDHGDLVVLSARPAGAHVVIEAAPEIGHPVWRARAPLARAPAPGDRVSAAIDPDYARVVIES